MLPAHMTPRASERYIVGTILREGADALDAIAGQITADDFTDYQLKLTFEVLEGMASRNVPIGILSVYSELGAIGRQTDVDASLLSDLSGDAGVAQGMAYHAKVMANAARRRKVLAASEAIRSGCLLTEMDTSDLVSQAFDVLGQIEERNVESGPRLVADIADDVLDAMDRNATGSVYSTGIHTVDYEADGFKPGELVILAARPGRGKSAMLNQWFRHFWEQGHHPLMFALEMRAPENVARMLAAQAQVNSRTFRQPREMSADVRERIMQARHQMRSMPNSYMDDRPDMTPGAIAATTRRYCRKSGCKVVLVDYLQLIRPTNPKEPRHQQVGEAARALKLLARNMGVVVIAAAQLNREIEGRGDTTPRLSDLRDSGEIEQHADFVFFLHGQDATKFEPQETVSLITGKGRSVSAGFSVELLWDKPRMTFREGAL